MSGKRSASDLVGDRSRDSFRDVLSAEYVGYVVVFFFFQAEDGIRDYKVTGVQTCALPIYPARHHEPRERGAGRRSVGQPGGRDQAVGSRDPSRSGRRAGDDSGGLRAGPDRDRKSVGEGKRGDLGGGRIIKKKKKNKKRET